MGKKVISGYAKKNAVVSPMAKVAGPKGRKGGTVPPLPPPASEGEVPDAAPIASPIQGSSSTPKMIQPGLDTGLEMRTPIGKT